MKCEPMHLWFDLCFMGVWSIFLQNYFWPEAVKRRKGDKACNSNHTFKMPVVI